MARNKPRIFIGVSGGVDSAVASALLLEEGYECHGVYMITNDHDRDSVVDAKRIGSTLDMPIHVLDIRSRFQQVIDYFIHEYTTGRTPNPCVFCNRIIKFGSLMDFALQHGGRYLATGHYIRVVHGEDESALYQADDPARGQSYVLAMIHRKVLRHVLFPMGIFSKDRTRRKASELGLHVQDKPDSQEICFIPDDDYPAALELYCHDLSGPGPVVDTDGNVLGEHEGIHRYTIGQRRGLGIAMGHPVYVTRIDVEKNRIVLGSREDMQSVSLLARGTNWLIDPPTQPFEARVKIRYNHKGAAARVIPGEKGDVKIEFTEPVFAVTPGQAAVFYVKDPNGWRMTGGAWIEKSLE